MPIASPALTQQMNGSRFAALEAEVVALKAESAQVRRALCFLGLDIEHLAATGYRSVRLHELQAWERSQF